MLFEEAKHILVHVAKERARWGKNYSGKDIGQVKVLEAAGVIGEQLEVNEVASAEKIRELQGKLSAALAREGRLKKQIEKQEEEEREREKVRSEQTPGDTGSPMVLP